MITNSTPVFPRKPQPTMRSSVYVAFLVAIFTRNAVAEETVYNVPPDIVPSTIGAGTTVNLMDGGAIGNFVTAQLGAKVNILGGTIFQFHALAGSEVVMSGGNALSFLRTFDGSKLTLSGGTMGEFAPHLGSEVMILGYDFRLDGIPIPGFDMVGNSALTSVPSDHIFSGTLADGTPFSLEQTAINVQQMMLTRVETPVLPSVVDVTTSSNVLGIGDGRTLNVHAAGSIPENFKAGRGSEVNILGGQAGENFEALSADVTLVSGKVGPNSTLLAGSHMETFGGSVGAYLSVRDSSLTVHDGQFSSFLYIDDSDLDVHKGSLGTVVVSNDSTANIAGGSIYYLRLEAGQPAASITGGTIEGVLAHAGSLSVRGGNYTNVFWASGSTLDLYGTEFRVDGRPVAGLQLPGDQVTVDAMHNDGTVLTATLADGTPFTLQAYGRRPPGPMRFGVSTETTVRLILAVPEPSAMWLLTGVCIFMSWWRIGRTD